jgi:hypothetical protein
MKGLHLVTVQTVIEHKPYQLINLVSQIALFVNSIVLCQLFGFSSLTFEKYSS